MKVRYDFHIHSGLSPCAEKDMTPCNIVGFAKLNDLDMVAISDHNSIGNVKVAIEAGKQYGVTVVPAMELQTNEDIHIICLFPDYPRLEAFYNSIEFADLKNRPDIFGNQYLYDLDDNIVGEEKRLLLTAAKISASEARKLALSFDGVAVPCHVDREENGMIAISGGIEEGFTAVELSLTAPESFADLLAEKYKIIKDSDAHTLLDIGCGSILDLKDATPKALIDYLKK